MLMRKFSKIVHSIASAGLIGGIGCYLVLIAVAVPESADGYLQMQNSILLVTNWVIVPSLIIALFTGLVSMVVHDPFQDKGWVWLKAGLGVIMFQSLMVSITGRAKEGASIARDVAAGEVSPSVIEAAYSGEWYTLWFIMAVSIANVVLGVWRPRRMI